MKDMARKIKSVKWVILLSCFVSSISLMKAQTLSKLDSLCLEAQKDNPPQIKVEKQLAYLDKLSGVKMDSAVHLLDSLVEVWKEEEFNFAIARGLYLKSWFSIFKAKYEESHRLAHKAFEMQLKDGTDSTGMGQSLIGIGVANLQFGRLDAAKEYLEKAIALFTQLKDTTRLDACYNNLGIALNHNGEHELAIENYKKSLNIRIQQKRWFWVAYSYFNIGSLFSDMEELDSTVYYLTKSEKTFQEKTESGRVPPMVLLGIGSLHYNNEEYEKAIEIGYKSLNRSKELKHTELIIQGTDFLAEVLYTSGAYKKAFEMKSELQQLISEFDSINSAAEVSEIEERYKNAEKEVELTQLKADKLIAINTAQRSRMMALYVTIAAILFGMILIFLYSKKRQKQKLLEADLGTKLSDMKLVALRSQMNPHFIFNCINTAQNFVLHSQKEGAYEYLAKFAKLLRIVLENSGQTTISLEDEMKHIQLYMELESIRFDEKFEFEINIDPELENGVFEIPSMILQPFVENAIIHGLVNKTDGKGVLKMVLKKAEDKLQCEIEDNGIGRKLASEIKKQKKVFYKSTAMPNIKERLKILEQNTGIELELEIIDLYNGNTASGTRVNLCLPLH